MSEPVPRQRSETVRRELIQVLEGGRFSVSELSKIIGRPEKEIYYHLEEINRAGRLTIVSAECLECGYVFRDRARAKKPGKCPRCKSTRIGQPLFSAKSG